MIAPTFLTIPSPRSGSAGAEAVDLAKLYGRPPDAEQAFALDVMLSESKPGKWAALETAIVEPRQNGKTGGVLLPAAMADLFLFNARMVIWTAHKLDTCMRTFADVKGLIEGCPDLSRRVKTISEGKGVEAIELTSGARMEFKARSKGGGRGFQGDSLTFDEALFLVDNQLSALVPTMSTVPNAQVRYGGSAGMPEFGFWYSVRDRGRKGTEPGLGYVEWCMDPEQRCGDDWCLHEPGAVGCRLDDERAWQQANHTLGGRITREYVRKERRLLSPESFMVERLGIWPEPEGESKISVDMWQSAVDINSESVGKPMFGVDASWGLRSGAIVACTWRADGTPHVETVAAEPGADWIPARLDMLRRRHKGKIAIPRNSPAIALLPAILKLRMDPYLIPENEMAVECTNLESALTLDPPQLHHAGDQVIEAAIRGAGAKPAGDGGWNWTRKLSTADISPVCAMTAGLRGLRLYVKPSYDLNDSFG